MKLPDGVKVTIGGVTYKGDIPEEVCPEFLKPAAKPGKKPTADDAAVAYPAAL